MARARRPLIVLIALVAVAGVVLRVWIYRSALGVPNSDEAVVGLMTRHAAHGDVSMFYWGSPYGGPQEVLLTVPLFWLFGSSYLAMRLVSIGLTAVASVLIWRVGRRTVGEPAATAAGALFWLWPPFDLFQLTQMQSFYAANVVYCALALLLALRVVERPDRMRIAILGFVLGFGFWETPHITPIAIPVAFWIVWKKRSVLRDAWIALVAAVVGALPWIVWNALHGWRSLGVHATLADYEHSLRLLASPILPMTLGLRTPFTQQPIVPSTALFYLVYVGALALFVYGAIKSVREPSSLLYAVAIFFPLLYAIDRRTSFITSWPQYTVVLTPVLTLIVAQLATRYWRAAALLGVALALEVVSIHRMDHYYRVPQEFQERAPRNIAPLVATLDRLGLDRVYADYWIAYLVDFKTNERIVAVDNRFTDVSFRNGKAVLPTDPEVRYRPYERKVEADPGHGFVFFRRTAHRIAILPSLERHGYARHLVGPFVVLTPPRA
jgi:4-amino-4-deoxy-L-arabinose transferase-like glycosyltransferase